MGVTNKKCKYFSSLYMGWENKGVRHTYLSLSPRILGKVEWKTKTPYI